MRGDMHMHSTYSDGSFTVVELMEMINSVKNIERTFKEELENGNFIVYYQPKFDIK